MSHTPGPWTCIKYPDVMSHTIYGSVSKTRSLASVKGPNAGDDARLIAAAPELLRACKVALWALRQNEMDFGTEWGACDFEDGIRISDILQEAITKANVSTP